MESPELGIRARRILWGAVTVLALIGVFVVARRAAHLVPILIHGYSPPTALSNPRLAQLAALDDVFARHPVLTLVHILPGLLFVVLGPLQFSSTLRESHLKWHRRSGRVLFLCGAVIGISAVIMSFAMPSIGGVNQAAATTLFGLWFLFALGKAFRHILRRETRRHREWMIRAFSIGLAVATIRPIIAVFFATSSFSGLTPYEFFGAGFWIGFVLHLMALDRKRRLFQPAQRRLLKTPCFHIYFDKNRRAMQTLVHDLRYGARMLLKKPGFTLIAVITLALGIGANTAIFSVVNAYLFKPLPVREPDRLVVLASKDQRSESPHGTSYLNYTDIRNQRDVFTDVIAYVPDIVSLNVDGEAERGMIELVSGNYFAMLGVEAAHGRTFAPNEGQSIGSSPVMVLSYGYWRRRFGGDVSAIGKTVKVNSQPFTIIGVAPENFPGTEPILTVNAYVPLMMKAQLHQNQQETFTQRGLESFRVMGRLAPGVSVTQAGAAMEILARNIARQDPDVFKELSFLVAPETKARPSIGASAFIPRMAAILMALTWLILLIACANAANLMLSRAAMRKKEMAIRSALGASRFRLIRLLLSESVLLGLLSGIAGIAIALWATDLLSSVRMATDNPVRFEARPDWRVFLFSLVAALATGIVTGLVPAFRSSRLDLSSSLKEGGRDSASGAGSHRLRNVLVVSQVAASLLLLVCAGLFLRSLQAAQQIDLGFRRDSVLMFSVDTELQSYDRQRGEQFYQRLLDRLSELPQVRSVGLGTHKSLVGWVPTTEVFLPEGGGSAKEDSVNVLANRVSADYFKTLNIPVFEGRAFTVRDDEAAPRVAVINETMAREYWPEQRVIGRHLRLERGGPPVEIIGVVANSKYGSIGEEPRPCLYLPFAQNYQSASILYLHTEGDPAAVTAAAHQVVSALDQGMPVYDLKTMNAHLNGIALLFVRLGAALVGAFGLLGLLLAVVGLFGVISHSVSQRTREIGIRIALGAQAGDVLRMVLKQGMILTLVGVATGLVTAFAVTRLMKSLLYGVSATDPLTFILISLLLASVALLACYLPARRATKVDPMIALRTE